MRAQILQQLYAMAEKEGRTKTVLEDVSIVRANHHIPRRPLVYNQTFCIALQGMETCYFGENALTYGPDQFLVAPTISPAQAEVFPHEGKPFFAVSITIDHDYVHEILDAIGQEYMTNRPVIPAVPGAYLEALTDDILTPVLRLLQSLGSRGEAEILAKPAIREIYYRALLGSNGHILAAVTRRETSYGRICHVLRYIQNNYASSFDVNHLAQKANMSPRAFYTHFKDVTALTPVQYLKHIRLEKARHYLVARGQRANMAAQLVGYESVSQFSREFKRHFGYPPREALKRNEA